ncbi:MAG: sugar MFS transporter [Bacteroidia bacterium]|nr:sugar MFS transporter [Bacteroidia bacterium]
MATPTTTTSTRTSGTVTTSASALYALISLFFMWGFITCMNDILIPSFKEMFTLTYFQAFLVQFAFFGAYFIGSLIFFVISATIGDPIQALGYKNGILGGLGLSAIACLMFYPAAANHSYGFFLGALFTLGLGFTLLQIAANPYVAIMGSPETAPSRLNLAQAFNSFGTTIAPLIGGYFIFEFFADAAGNPTPEGLQTLYPIFAVVFILVGVFMFFMPLPKVESDPIEPGIGALRFPHLRLGMVAIFMYVGGEVVVGSALINFFGLPEIMGMDKTRGDIFLAFYWGGAMIGRFAGAVAMGDTVQSVRKYATMLGVALAAFAFIFFAAWFKSKFTLTFGEVWPFLLLIVLNFAGFYAGQSMPGRTFAVFSGANLLLLLVAVFASGPVAFWSIIGIGLFNSIMWSNIFTLSIDGLGKYTSQGSSLLVMMILGGALLPPLQGIIADKIGLQISFVLAMICYAYLLYYGAAGYKAGKDRL